MFRSFISIKRAVVTLWQSMENSQVMWCLHDVTVNRSILSSPFVRLKCLLIHNYFCAVKINISQLVQKLQRRFTLGNIKNLSKIKKTHESSRKQLTSALGMRWCCTPEVNSYCKPLGYYKIIKNVCNKNIQWRMQTQNFENSLITLGI